MNAIGLTLLRLESLQLGSQFFLDIRQHLLSSLQPFLTRLILLLFQRVDLHLESHFLSFENIDGLWSSFPLDLDLGTSFIHNVDGRVRRSSCRDILSTELSGEDEGSVGDPASMVSLVTLLETSEDIRCGGNIGLLDDNLSETSFQSGILLDKLSVLGQSGRSDKL